MPDSQRAEWRPHSVAYLALGYGVTYTLFALVVRSLNISSLPTEALVVGFVVGFTPVLVASLLWVRRQLPKRQKTFLLPLPQAVSGLATAAIALTTVIALGHASVSLVLVLVLMRGGVLLLSPLIDYVGGRSIGMASAQALGLSLAAVTLVFLNRASVGFDPDLLAVLAAYLIAYAVRLSLMVRGAKRLVEGSRGLWFLQEQLAALITLVVAALFLFVNGDGATLTLPPLSAVAAGASYGLVLAFGSLIYLDHRELTFAVPINRAVSLCAGLVSTLILFLFADEALPAIADFIGAGLVIAALSILLRHDARAASAISPKPRLRVSSAPKA